VARFILTHAVFGQPPGGVAQRFGRGTTLADTAVNAQPGDVVWPALVQAPVQPPLLPLDIAGQTLMPGYAITTLAQLATSSVGGGTAQS
jgi:hypothetical protein